MTTAILCFCCPGTGQQKRQSSIYSPVATYGSRKNAAGAYAAAAWVKKRLIFVGIIFIYFQVGLNRDLITDNGYGILAKIRFFQCSGFVSEPWTCSREMNPENKFYKKICKKESDNLLWTMAVNLHG